MSGEAAASAGAARWQIAGALFAVYVIWGSTYLVMRIALVELPPMLMGAIRFAIAGSVLVAIATLRGEPWPRLRQWARAAPIGLLLFAGGNGLVAVAELQVSSGLAAVVVATMPLWMALLGLAIGERPSVREWLGLGLGMIGVVVLISGAELSAAPVAAIALCASPVAWAFGSLLSRKLDVPKGLMGSASFQLMGALAMLGVGMARGEQLPTTVSGETIGAMAYLVVFGSVIGFTAYTWLLVHTRPALATSYAFVNPPLAVLLGAMLGAEAVGSATLLATPLVVAAVLLVVSGKQKPK